MRLNHVRRGHPFGMPFSQRQAGVDQHAVAVLHQPASDEAALPLPLRYSLVSESVVEAWVPFERLWPWKSASALRPPPSNRSIRSRSERIE